MEHPIAKLTREAYQAFDIWRQEHDPDGEMGIVDAVAAYGRWCDAGNKVVIPGIDDKPTR